MDIEEFEIKSKGLDYDKIKKHWLLFLVFGLLLIFALLVLRDRQNILNNCNNYYRAIINNMSCVPLL